MLPDNEQVVAEQTTPTFTGTLKDSAGVAVTLASLSTLTLTQWLPDGTIINSRDSQNVLNANNVTYHATSGLITWNLQTTDTSIVGIDPNTELETHYYEFAYTFTSGSNTFKGVNDPINGPASYKVRNRKLTL